jgi:hypothetical protein
MSVPSSAHAPLSPLFATSLSSPAPPHTRRQPRAVHTRLMLYHSQKRRDVARGKVQPSFDSSDRAGVRHAFGLHMPQDVANRRARADLQSPTVHLTANRISQVAILDVLMDFFPARRPASVWPCGTTPREDVDAVALTPTPAAVGASSASHDHGSRSSICVCRPRLQHANNSPTQSVVIIK